MDTIFTIRQEDQRIVLQPIDLDYIIDSAIDKYLEKNTKPFLADPILLEKPVKIEQIAELLNVTRQTVSDYKRRGLIPFEKIGGRIFFYESKVLESLKKFKVSK
jgi:excisionase family DNA binding protein